jgi:hypothetical protein
MNRKESEVTKWGFNEQLLDAIGVTKEWLDILSKIELKDEVRAAKIIEVAIKLVAQICVLGLRKLGQKDQEIAEGLRGVILDNEYKVEHDSIYRYSIADQRPEPEIAAKLFVKYGQDNKGLYRRAEKRRL